MIHGDVPKARDGHAAWVIGDRMIIYGGSKEKRTFSNIYAFEFKGNRWVKLRITGDGPGPRESMGYANIGDKLFIFGGILGSNRKGVCDSYSSDLYQFSIREDVL